MRGRYGILYFLGGHAYSVAARRALIAAHDIIADMPGSSTFGVFRHF